MDAILEATIQVLLQGGKERLTTTKVALKAGVSVGTLYQYFPNKSAVLKAALKRHMDEVAEAVELVCREQKGNSLEQMAAALVTAFLAAKMKDARTSVALYSVSSDVDGARIVQEMGVRLNKAIAALLKSSSEQLATDPQLVASMLQGVLAGVSRRLLESAAPVQPADAAERAVPLISGATPGGPCPFELQFDMLRQETVFLACAYLNACAAPPDRRWDACLTPRPETAIRMLR